ncbi:uncharacterized protein M6B38_177175 [Iris pallida]|uniref:PHD-type domain-containing protein n=1 Tax=Iris pallida TaxID=29817 RepID=A0AAX6EPP0_IRIPA|nr:uncharacterized protein M6B38_177175 [Iris pallida]
MANGGSPSSDPGGGSFVFRSGVRASLKRELAFALKSQAEISSSLTLSRTRSGRPTAPSSSSSSRSNKRIKKSSSHGVDVDDGRPVIPSSTTSKPKEEEEYVDAAAAAFGAPIAVLVVVKDEDEVAKGSTIQIIDSPSRRITTAALVAAAAAAAETTTPTTEVDGSVSKELILPTNADGTKEDNLPAENAASMSTKKPDDQEDVAKGAETPMEIDQKEAEEDGFIDDGSVVVTPTVADHASCQGSTMESSKSPRRRFTRSLFKSPVPETVAGQYEAGTSLPDRAAPETTTRRLTRSASKLISGVSEASPPPTPMETGNTTGESVEAPIDVNDQQGSRGDFRALESGASPETPARRLTRSASKAMSVDSEPLPTPPPPPSTRVADSREIPVEIPIIVNNQQEPKLENGVAVNPPSKKFKRLAMKVLKENTPMMRDECSLQEKPGRRFTRSLLKSTTTDEPAAGENSGSIASDKTTGGASGGDGHSSSASGKKMELKMSKKIALHKLPTNVRELLGTGLLEGLPVKYNDPSGKQVGLEGVVHGNGILCSCDLCKGSKVVSAYNFQLHAGSTKKHPPDFIYLENGKNLRDILTECRSTSLDMLEAAIHNAIGPLPQRGSSVCQNRKELCAESLHSPRTGKFGLLCDSFLLANQKQHTSPSPSQRTPSNAKLSSKVLAGCASDCPSRNASSQKKNATSSKVFVGDACDFSSKNTSSQKKSVQGKITRKDLGLHKLVFMDDILPEGTEVGYYVRGKRLLEGYIKDSGIYCRCCDTVVSPSQFEAHAGRASRRKPYNNIYTSNGVSLHELSVSLSKDRKLSSDENDDLCSICADGGDLLLCDLCPRAFHKECVGLSSIPRCDWYCRYCRDMHEREKAVGYNDNAIAAGRVAGVDSIEQIIKRCIRIVTTSTDFGVCVLCRCHDFSKSGFDGRTVLICDQCEKEYHVGCLKDHEMCDLKELPEGEWFCCAGCSEIHAALHKTLLRGLEPLQNFYTDVIRKKCERKGLSEDAAEVRWRLLSGKTSSNDTKLLLSEAVSIFHESFDPIVDAVTGRDLIPSMVYGRSVRDQDFGGMYCAVLTVNSSVVSAGILRVLGSDVAELPLVATNRESQGQGYFQSLFSCIERLLEALKVKHFVLPAAEEAESIWTKKFGFSKISLDQLYDYTKGARPIIFQGTSLLHKRVSLSQSCLQQNHGS